MDGTETRAEMGFRIALVVTLAKNSYSGQLLTRTVYKDALPFYSFLGTIESIWSRVQETVHVRECFDCRSYPSL